MPPASMESASSSTRKTDPTAESRVGCGDVDLIAGARAESAAVDLVPHQRDPGELAVGERTRADESAVPLVAADVRHEEARLVRLAQAVVIADADRTKKPRFRLEVR